MGENTTSASNQAAAELVVKAFANTRYPGDDAIARGQTANWTARYGDSYEGAEVARLFMGKRWQDVDLDVLRHPLGGFHQQALSFLSDEAVGYYAPALMLIALEHGTDADTFLSDAIDIFGTKFTGDAGSLDRRCDRYTPRQRSAVAAFLSAMVDVEYDGDPTSKPAKILSAHWR